MKFVLVLGNQLFPKSASCISAGDHIFMAEDYGLCTHYRYHKHKLIFFLSSMRHYRDYLEATKGTRVTYHHLENMTLKVSFEKKLTEFLETNDVDELHVHEIEDKFFEERIISLCEKRGIQLVVHPSPMFFVTREKFKNYLGRSKKPFMKTFYEELRRETGYLMEKNGKPEGGKYSFDADNREKLPKNHALPDVKLSKPSKHVREVSEFIDIHFSEHPGQSENFWLPVTRKASEQWLKAFLEERFHLFGNYEDAIATAKPFLYHSVLSPLLNIGLLTPEEVIEKALQFKNVPINSREGFLRQVIGWREFIRGIYQNYSEVQETENFWGHERKFKRCWYDGTTGMPPVDDAIKKALEFGYNHHIERLMILSNVMLLVELSPTEVHRWFMEMYVDSSDWVMGPNVYGMGQFSDGGIFATKPYTCGSNYIRKMSNDYGKGPWCDELDGLYWRFIDKHRDFYKKNPRMATMVGTFDRMKSERKELILKAANAFQERVTSG